MKPNDPREMEFCEHSALRQAEARRDKLDESDPEHDNDDEPDFQAMIDTEGASLWLWVLLGLGLISAPLLGATFTGYCLCQKCCGQGATGINAAGKRPVEGISIAAPRAVPLGTRVHVQGVGWRVVDDRTARRFDGRWDLFFSRHADALAFGKKSLKVSRPSTK